MKEDEIIESRFVSKTIERAQEKVEKHNFETRKHLLEYDDVLNQQRTVIYAYRREVLEGEERIYELYVILLLKLYRMLLQPIAKNIRLTTDQTNAVYGSI